MDHIGVIGGGIGGLCVARALAQAGHQVTLIEPDTSASGMSADEAFTSWVRPHIAQLRQPHAARSIIRKLLLARDPELYRAIVDGGMVEWAFELPKVGDEQHDPELVGLLGRRPTLEKALRQAVERTPRVTILKDRVVSLERAGDGRASIESVRTKSGERLVFDAYVECTGRRSKLLDWLEAMGLPRPPEISQDCGIIYYSRYFRFREGAEIDRVDYPSGPSANLSTLQYTMNRTDDGTFSLMLGVAPWEPIFSVLNDETVYMQVVRALPGTLSWLAPEVCEPIWRVERFGGLVNRYRSFSREGEPILDNLFVLGDSRFHTNPIFGWGMGMAMRQAHMLADAFAEGTSAPERVRIFDAEVNDFARRHYEASAGEDVARARYWRGELSAPQEPGTYEYFVTQVQPAAFKDQRIFQAVTRRLHLLDDPNAILLNEEVNQLASHIPRMDHTKMPRAQILSIVEAAAREHLSEKRLQLATRA